MSKRKGDYITVEDLINEVGKDATRFIMLNRSSDVELDFDFTKVKEKSKDNPIYYVQYCYATISSVYRKLNKNIDDTININSNLNDLSGKGFDATSLLIEQSKDFDIDEILYFLTLNISNNLGLVHLVV